MLIEKYQIKKIQGAQDPCSPFRKPWFQQYPYLQYSQTVDATFILLAGILRHSDQGHTNEVAMAKGNDMACNKLK